jgi:hypothetical protein
MVGGGGAERTVSPDAGWLSVWNGGKEEKVLSRDVVCFRLVGLDGEGAERALSLSRLELEGADSHEAIEENALSLDGLCFTLLELNGSGTDKLFSPDEFRFTALEGDNEGEAHTLVTLSLKVACLAGAEDGKALPRDLLCFRLGDLARGGRERVFSLGTPRLRGSGLAGLEGRIEEDDVL